MKISKYIPKLRTPRKPGVRREFVLFGLIVFGFSITVSACINDDDDDDDDASGKRVEVGVKIPHFSTKKSDLSEISSDLLKGKRVVLIFFNSGCGDCRKYLPAVDALRKEIAEDSTGEYADVEFLCISRADRPDRIADFWESANLTLPYAPETDRKIYDSFGATRVPRTYVLNAESVCVATYGDNDAPDAAELKGALRKAR